MSFQIHVEGRVPGKAARIVFRRGFSKFFESAGLRGRMPRTFPCGNRQGAFDAFELAVETAASGEVPLLLVDSEEAVEAGATACQHLAKKAGWKRPKGVSDDQIFLMVQVMETWFIADPESLARYFGQGFQASALPQQPNPESVPKKAVLEGLNKATRTAKPDNDKGEPMFDLLGVVRPEVVRKRCPSLDRLLRHLSQPTGGESG